LLIGCALLLLAGPSSAGARKSAFSLGVAAGDVTAHGAILWAHAKRATKATIELRKGGKARCDDATKGEPRAKASKSDDFTTRKKVGGLRPGTSYAYRFCGVDGGKSPVGHFETAPKKGKAKTVRFGLSGDFDATAQAGSKKPFWNDFEVMRRMAKEGNDFNILLGDTIYSDSEVPGSTAEQIALTVKRKWARYRLGLKQANHRMLRGSTGLYSSWDDHEFINDFARGMNAFTASLGFDVAFPGETLFARGKRAFLDYTPAKFKQSTGLYRSVRWGRNAELFFLDSRSFRSNTADYQGVCDNPQTGEPDFFPTAPQSYRDQFALLRPDLAEPVSQQCIDTINDPNRTMLGATQLQKLESALAKSGARWKIIVNPLTIQQYYVDPYDDWEGYEAERRKLVDFIRANVKNAVFLSTDVHSDFVNDIRFKTLDSGPGANERTGIMDVATGPIATATFATEIDNASFAGASGVLYSRLFKPQPPNGVGMQCAALDRYSYMEVKATAKQLRIDLRDIKRAPVQETALGNAVATCPPIVLNAQP
jgi:alkaline phosphatase D